MTSEEVMTAPVGKGFSPAPQGTWQGVCVDIIGHEDVETQWGKRDKVEFRWQLHTLMEDGKPFMVTAWFNLTMNEQGRLRPFVESWLGVPFQDDNEAEGFNLFSLLRRNCMLQIFHRPSNKGGIFANVETIMPLPANMPLLKAIDYVRVKDRPQETDGRAEPAQKAPLVGAPPLGKVGAERVLAWLQKNDLGDRHLQQALQRIGLDPNTPLEIINTRQSVELRAALDEIKGTPEKAELDIPF